MATVPLKAALSLLIHLCWPIASVGRGTEDCIDIKLRHILQNPKLIQEPHFRLSRIDRIYAQRYLLGRMHQV